MYFSPAEGETGSFRNGKGLLLRRISRYLAERDPHGRGNARQEMSAVLGCTESCHGAHLAGCIRVGPVAGEQSGLGHADTPCTWGSLSCPLLLTRNIQQVSVCLGARKGVFFKGEVLVPPAEGLVLLWSS